MALPVTFGALAGGPGVTQPLTLLDQNFTALGNLAVIPCAAAGSNSITLTPLSNTPAIASYQSFQPRVAWVQAQTSTATGTANFGGLGSRTIYKNNGLTVTGANDLLAGGLYWADFNPALNAGAGGWVLINPPVPTAVATAYAWGSFKRLRGVNTSGFENAQFNWLADSIIVSDGISNFAGLLNINVSPSLNGAGANGLDTGVLAANTWYAGYVIYNPSTLTVAGLWSTSFTSPTLPAGFTMFARLGAAVTDGAGNLKRIIQFGRNSQYLVTPATNTTALPAIAAGVAGTWSATAPTWLAVGFSGLAPPLTSAVRFITSNQYNNGALAHIAFAPTSNYAGALTTNPPLAATSATVIEVAEVAFNLENSTNAAWVSDAAGGALLILGWEDNL